MTTVSPNLEAFRELIEGIRDDKPLPADIDDIINDCNTITDEIRVELASLSPAQRAEVVKELQGYQRVIDGAKKRMVIGDSGASSQHHEADAQAVAQHNRNMDRLQKSREQLNQAEVTSQQTMENLQRQTEQMQRINNNLAENQQELSTSNKLLNHMNKWWRP